MGVSKKNKGSVAKPIGNPFYKDLEKVTSSFYATNFPDLIDSRCLRNICATSRRFVDALLRTSVQKGVSVLDLFVLWALKMTTILLYLCPTYGTESYTCIICWLDFRDPLLLDPKWNKILVMFITCQWELIQLNLKIPL